MKKKLVIIVGILFLLIVAGYLYLRFGVLKVKDFKPDVVKEKTILDLRPAIIAKLQQLIKDGSHGLYILSIDKLEPHILESKLDAVNAYIKIDTVAMRHLDSLHLLPDDIFTFHFTSLHIDGIGIDDLLHKDRIDITGIHVANPMVNLYHKKRSYNEAERKHTDSLSLYQRLKGHMQKIGIGKIDFTNTTFINHDLAKNKTSKFTAVSILINDLLIDSSTQHDNSRFLFAKHTTIHTKNYTSPTPDSLYFFKIADISIAGEQHTVTARDFELVPRYSQQQFERKLKYRKDMYHFSFPKVSFTDIDWLAIINNEKFSSKHIQISGGLFSDFLDRSVPSNPSVTMDNFPHQLLMKIPFKVDVERLDINNVNVSYEEYNPASAQHGTAYFDNISGTINHISNIPSVIKSHPVADFSGKAMFMHHVPMNAKFIFDLAKYRTGEFSVKVNMDTLDNITINKIAEPLGLFSVKTGVMQHADGFIKGNNAGTSGTMTMTYNNLHITPLKKGKEETAKLKKKTVTSFLANAILIKNDNPKGNELRQPTFTVERDHHANFFNLIWTSVLTGILKSIGVPVKLAIKN